VESERARARASKDREGRSERKKKEKGQRKKYGEEGRDVLIENSGIRRGIKHSVLD
jgi:hypothetical protein